jgi:hypothetical protein
MSVCNFHAQMVDNSIMYERVCRPVIHQGLKCGASNTEQELHGVGTQDVGQGVEGNSQVIYHRVQIFLVIKLHHEDALHRTVAVLCELLGQK